MLAHKYVNMFDCYNSIQGSALQKHDRRNRFIQSQVIAIFRISILLIIIVNNVNRIAHTSGLIQNTMIY